MPQETFTFAQTITTQCQKKESLYLEYKTRYLVRSIYAGILLTFSTAAGAFAAGLLNQFDPVIGRLLFSFIFSFGLVFILFLRTELATSNMMYLTAGVIHEALPLKNALKILFYCTLGNLIGALAIGFLIANTGAFIDLTPDHYIAATVQKKLAKDTAQILIEAVLANMLVNTGILGYLFAKNEMAKITIVVSAISMFVLLGYEHVIANFSSFSIVAFTQVAGEEWFTIGGVVRQWALTFVGNYIGGGILMGFVYAWLNRVNISYID